MTCPGCAEPDRGIVISTCRQCLIRDLAGGPLFFEAVKKQRITPRYKAALVGLFGDEWKAGHERVKAAAKGMFVFSEAA